MWTGCFQVIPQSPTCWWKPWRTRGRRPSESGGRTGRRGCGGSVEDLVRHGGAGWRDWNIKRDFTPDVGHGVMRWGSAYPVSVAGCSRSRSGASGRGGSAGVGCCSGAPSRRPPAVLPLSLPQLWAPCSVSRLKEALRLSAAALSAELLTAPMDRGHPGGAAGVGEVLAPYCVPWSLWKIARPGCPWCVGRRARPRAVRR